MARAILAIVLTLYASQHATAAEPQRPPNFLFILGDNLGKDWIGCYGSDEACTPNIDKLAVGGTRFIDCYVTALCSTTRAELWSGRYGFRTGWTTHHDAAIYGGGGFDWNREVTLARALKSAGYATAITGKWQINDFYEQPDALTQHGFDEHLVWTGAIVGEGTADARWKASLKTGEKHELESRYWDPVIFKNGRREVVAGKFGPDLYADYLIDFMGRNRERPFFAFYSTPLTHIPTVTTPGSPDAAAPQREQFAGMVRYLDGQVARLVGELDRLGLRENTIVIFTTDNGTSRNLGGRVGGKQVAGGLGTLSENGLNVPLIVNCPGRVAADRTTHRLVDCSDFYPTLLELAGAKSPADVTLDGISFASHLSGKETNPFAGPRREWMCTQYADERVVSNGRHKLYSSGKLFDLETDPLEKANLIASTEPQAAEARKKLQAVLAGLPPDAKLPFAFRSSSAFNLERKKSQPQQ